MNTLLAILVILMAGCASESLGTATRVADAMACLTAIESAGIPLLQAIRDQNSTDIQKAQAAKGALAQANLLPACLKMGANAAVVIGENINRAKNK